MNLLNSTCIPKDVHKKIIDSLNRAARQITILTEGRQLEPHEYEVKGGIFNNQIITIKGNIEASKTYTLFCTEPQYNKLKKFLGKNFYKSTKRK